jgi:hypothetical protein
VTRGRWRDPDYLAWWWRTQVSADTKIVAAVVAIGVLGLGGYVAANGLEGSVGAAEADGGQVELVTTTVQKLVTVQVGGSVVTTPTRVVARRVGGGVTTERVTQVRVATVAGPAGTRVVTEREVVPVERRVTVAGDVRTVVQQAPAETQTRTVEREVERVVERVVTQERVVTVPAVARTVTETVVVTVATPPVTVTAGPITLTVTLPLPPILRP